MKMITQFMVMQIKDDGNMIIFSIISANIDYQFLYKRLR